MHTSHPGRASAALVTVAAALVAAFVLAPARLAASPSTDFADGPALADGVRAAFVDHWRSGDRDLSPRLRAIVDYWFRYHLVKAVVAAALLCVFVALAALLWRTVVRTRGRRAVPATGGVLATGLAVFSLVVTMANVQGAVAPFASLLPMLVDGPADGDLAAVLEQVRSSDPQPTRDLMVDDFVRYHAAMAVIATVVAVSLLFLGVMLWRRLRATAWSARSSAVFCGVVAVAMAVVAVANATTAADPMPAFQSFLDGGW